MLSLRTVGVLGSIFLSFSHGAIVLGTPVGEGGDKVRSSLERRLASFSLKKEGMTEDGIGEAAAGG
jgi:hypothetical protein